MTAENEDDAWVEEFESYYQGIMISIRPRTDGDGLMGIEPTFSPLQGFVCICLLGHLFNLPWAPCLVAESPVFDLDM